MNPQGRETMQGLLPDVTEDERNALFRAHHRDDSGPATLANLIPSLLLGLDFIGSWSQGDWLGVALEVGLGAAGIGAILWGVQVVGWGLFSESNPAAEPEADVLFSAGLVLIFAGWLTSLGRPWTFQDQWNKNLALSLGVINPDSEEQVSFATGRQRTAERRAPRLEVDLVSVAY